MFGPLSARLGGLPLLALTALGTVAFTCLLTLSRSYASLVLLWAPLRLLSSSSWIGVVQIASQYVPFETRARAMSFLTLSFVTGDLMARLLLGAVISAGVTWRQVCVCLRVVLWCVVCVVCRVSCVLCLVSCVLCPVSVCRVVCRMGV